MVLPRSSRLLYRTPYRYQVLCIYDVIACTTSACISYVPDHGKWSGCARLTCAWKTQPTKSSQFFDADTTPATQNVVFPHDKTTIPDSRMALSRHHTLARVNNHPCIHPSIHPTIIQSSSPTIIQSSNHPIIQSSNHPIIHPDPSIHPFIHLGTFY